jgi:hypothetical protein
MWLQTEAPAFPEAPGTTVTVGLAVWYNGGGVLTFAQAYNGFFPYGESPTGNVTLGGGTIPVPDLPGGPDGIQTFSLAMRPIPEPNTIALGVIGASAFLLHLPRK